jgi:hypothetical protein
MPAAPLAAGLNIVVPVVRVGSAPGLLPATLAFPLAVSGSAEFLLGALRTGVKELVTSGTTSLFHARPLFDQESILRVLVGSLISVKERESLWGWGRNGE